MVNATPIFKCGTFARDANLFYSSASVENVDIINNSLEYLQKWLSCNILLTIICVVFSSNYIH